ncbi:hypothetical protein [Catenovulum maritimum]|uniref:Uncharacterized protein n=1 Tax=Catenovulum maritimum TaxID=1513271 RepID=A0A0J8JQT1_9ALTE|nr:hypothetical protein [Catenovulum maritimum]KMT67081.1 hypothetical protein XM47_00375 [Catenovulum maritimum]
MLTGRQCSNWGSLALNPAVFFFLLDIIIQEVTQDSDECEVADEPVVVNKPRPVKASNGVEDKTKVTINRFDGIY